MLFCALAQELDKIEKLSSRIAITEHLGGLFKSASSEEAKLLAYLLCGGLRPKYDGLHFNIADKQMLAALKGCVDEAVGQKLEDTSKKAGDLGQAFAAVWNEVLGFDGPCLEKCNASSKVALASAYDSLEEIAKSGGTGSVEVRAGLICKLVGAMCPGGAKYVIRIVLGKLRLGFSEMTILDALSWMEVGAKTLKDPLETAFNASADIGLIAERLKTSGVEGIKRIHVKPGIPIRPAAAERAETVEKVIDKLCIFAAQPKLDGLRIQVHKFSWHGRPKIVFFSRNLLDVTEMFPELAEALETFPADSFIAEGEAIAFDKDNNMFFPFQETAKRRRKHDVDEQKKLHPLRLYLFDLLFLNGKSILDHTHAQRRDALQQLFDGQHAGKATVKLIEQKMFDQKSVEHRAEALTHYFEHQIEMGLEGLVAKRIDSPYKAGKRNFNWIKLKYIENSEIDDTIDCVIMGYYQGRGKRASFGIGALLAGIYNQAKDRFESVCKIGTGMTDDEFKSYKKACDENSSSEIPKNYVVAKDLAPDVWVSPKIVVSVRADDISRSPLHSAAKEEIGQGLALRFPRVMELRIDKSPEDATSAKELVGLFKSQKLIKE